jgi:hypothetical protein
MGVPTGDLQYKKDQVEAMISKMIQPLAAIHLVDHKNGFNILRSFINARPCYLARVCDPPIVEEGLKRFDKAVDEALLRLTKAVGDGDLIGPELMGETFKNANILRSLPTADIITFGENFMLLKQSQLFIFINSLKIYAILTNFNSKFTLGMDKHSSRLKKIEALVLTLFGFLTNLNNRDATSDIEVSYSEHPPLWSSGKSVFWPLAIGLARSSACACVSAFLRALLVRKTFQFVRFVEGLGGSKLEAG